MIVPVGSGVDRVHEQLPLASAITGALVQSIGFPVVESTSLTVEPGSALPVTVVSVFLTGLTVGAEGAVVSAVVIEEEFIELETVDDEDNTVEELAVELDATLLEVFELEATLEETAELEVIAEIILRAVVTVLVKL